MRRIQQGHETRSRHRGLLIAIASVLLLIPATLILVRAIDYYMATQIFGYVFTSIRGTRLPDEITQAIAILITGLAVILVPMLAFRLIFGFSLNRDFSGPLLQKLGIRRRYKETILLISGIWAAWVMLTYFMIMPNEGELFNPYTKAARYKYYQDEAGTIHVRPLGYMVLPENGEELRLITTEIAKKYHQQRSTSEVSEELSSEAGSKPVEIQRAVVEKPCYTVEMKSTEFALAKDGSGLRLWIKLAQFYPNRTTIMFLAEPGAGPSSIYRSNGFFRAELLLGSRAEAAAVQDWGQYPDGRRRPITSPVEFRVDFGPVINQGEITLRYPFFHDYKFKFENLGCPMQKRLMAEVPPETTAPPSVTTTLRTSSKADARGFVPSPPPRRVSEEDTLKSFLVEDTLHVCWGGHPRDRSRGDTPLC